MQKITVLFTALLLSVFQISTAQAADLGPVKGRFSLGYTDSSGNTDESKANFAFALDQKKNDELRLHYNGLALYGKADGVKNMDKKQLGFLSEFIKTNRRSLYASLGYMQDEFAGYDKQLKLGLGFIRYIVNEEFRNLSVSLGYDFTQEDYTDGTERDRRWLKAGFKGRKKVDDNVFVTASFEAMSPNHSWDKAYRTASALGLYFNINSKMDAEMKYLYDYNRRPVDDKDKKDSTFITAISYKM